MKGIRMAKKPAKEKLPRCSGTMTESQFLSWIRSALRSKSLRWKPRTDALELARRPYKGDNKRQKYEYQCAICKGWFKAADVVVDHYPVAAGSILSIDDVGQFCNNLYCEVDNLRVLCNDDHDAYTLQQKNPGMTFEEAKFEKLVNYWMKKENRKDLLVMLSEFKYNCKNDEQRKEAIRKILKEKA
jgi:hypothetical protein